MLKRKCMDNLLAWKRNKTTQALLVTGARQVGKTYAIQEFGRTQYAHLVTFDLVAQPDLARALDEARNAEELFVVLSAFSEEPMVPWETLVFIDEVQECKEVVSFIKRLVQRHDYDFVLSGSLLGVELRGVRSLPVGYLDVLEVYPLDFEEFTWAHGIGSEVWDAVRACFEDARPLIPAVHERLLSLFHQYLFVGGMPRVVETFVDTHDVARTKAVQDNILTL